MVGINKMEEEMTRYQKMTEENLSDTIKRGFMKALTNEAELQKHVFRNSTRLSTYEKMREEVMSALMAERGSARPDGGRPDGDWSRRQERLEGHRQERTGQERSKGSEKGLRPSERLRNPEPQCRSRVLLLSPQGTHQRGMQNSYGRRDSKSMSCNVTGLKGISGEDIPWYGHVELNLRRGQDVFQVGAEVADIEHGIIATDAIVKRRRSVFAQPGRTLDCGRNPGTTITDDCNQTENASSQLLP